MENHRVLPVSLLPHRVWKEHGDSLVFAVEGTLLTSVGPGCEFFDY